MRNIVSDLRTFATLNSLHFIYGTDEYKSADRKKYKANEKVLAIDYEAGISYDRDSLSVADITHTVTMMFGQKSESTTRANLDETMLQKHDARLATLQTYGLDSIKKFACAYDLYLVDVRITIAPNMFSDNIDFVIFIVNFVE